MNILSIFERQFFSGPVIGAVVFRPDENTKLITDTDLTLRTLALDLGKCPLTTRKIRFIPLLTQP